MPLEIKATINRHPQSKIGYLSQNNVDEISAAQSSESTLEYIQKRLSNVPEIEIRGHFGGFGISGDLIKHFFYQFHLFETYKGHQDQRLIAFRVCKLLEK